MCLCDFCGFHDIFIGDVAAEANIFLDGVCIEKIVLEYDAEHGGELLACIRTYISSVYANYTLIDIVKAHQKAQ